MFQYIKRKFFRHEYEEHSRDNTQDAFLFGVFDNASRRKKWQGSSDKVIQDRGRLEWLEETFVDYSEEELSSTRKNYLGLGLNKRRIIGFFAIILIGVSLLFLRSVYLQVVKGDYYRAVAEQNRIRIYNLPAPRGIIYDQLGTALVKNIPNFAVFIVPFDLNLNQEKKEQTVVWLKKSLAEREAEIGTVLEKILALKSTAKEYFEPVLLVDGLDYDEAIKLRVGSASFNSVSVEVRPKREYLNQKSQQTVLSLSHLLGYLGKINEQEYADRKDKNYLINDNIGKTGIESYYEEILRGQYGREQIEVDSTGTAIKILAKEELQKGDNLFLSIDLNMQAKMEEIIFNYFVREGQRNVAAVAMNPQTGKIYSLVSWPSYDNNKFAQGISIEDYQKLIENENNPLFNRAISGEYPSGSTIKPVIGAAALEEGIIQENSSFLSTGGIKISQWFFPDWKAGGHGITNIYKALSESVNTFFYIVGGGYQDRPGLGVYKIKEYAEKFGLNQQTNIDLPNEATGFLPTPEWKEEVKQEAWYIGDSYHLAIGQGDLLVTPLQVANYTSVFANKGRLMKPFLLDRIYNQETGQEEIIEPEVVSEYFVKENNLNIIRGGMRQAVTTGSARILNGLPVSAAAKTGTAQWKTDETPHSWFTAFAPFDSSELVVTVLVEQGGEGSEYAAWIAYDFMNWYFRSYK